jgi:fused signal recognition particle receptor
MEEILSLLSILPSPFSDLAAVIAIFIVIALISFVISYFFQEKPGKELEEPAVSEPPEEIPEAAPAEPVQEAVHDIEEKVLETIEEALPHEPVPGATIPVEPESAQEIIEEVKAAAEAEPIEMPQEEVAGEPLEISEEEDVSPEGLFTRLRSGLSKTHSGIFGRLGGMLSKREIDEGTWDDFEETLIMADLGVSTTMKLRESLESKLAKKSLGDEETIEHALKEEILEILKSAQGDPIKAVSEPFVIMVAGVNGVGKTTTIGKLAYTLKQKNQSVMVAAGDTFRAAAMEQLEVWSKRVGTEFLKGESGRDPSSVAFDAVKAAISKKIGILIIDTAGRLHTKDNLMEELKKMKRVVGRELEGAPHETLLVLDATTGQNAIQQAKTFNEVLDITGIVLTKLDGTAKGGIIIAIADELNIPVKYIGIGESLSDLREFNAEEFVEALFYSGDEAVH